jgi:branched-chain amino acid transport system ATP-binding protein
VWNLLEVDDIHSYYGSAHILQGISLSIKKGEAVALLGRNGTGKTTTLKSIMSLIQPREGKILYDGRDITGLPPYLVARKGLSMVPEGRHIFPALNVIQHLRVPVSSSIVDRDRLLSRVFNIFPELQERKKQNASALSGGEQQMLVIARDLMTDPKLLLLDEPMEGLAPKAVARVIESMKVIQKEGVTIFFASADLKRAFEIARRAYILEKGKVVFHLTEEHLGNSLEIQQKYLGVRE